MGVVYKARDITLGRFVALKFLPHVEPFGSPGRAAEEESEKTESARFLQEARAASALDHPYLCTVYEVGKYKGSPFIAMQFLQGQPLSEVIDGKSCALSQILQVGVQVADGLGAAHNAGIVHGDIKPANIFVMATRQEIKILDFGLAKIGPGQSGSDFGEPSALVGTVAYMSPEQVRGEALDARSDLFSLGVTLYEATTGRLPFAGESSKEILETVLLTSPPAPSSLNPQLPRTFDTIIAKTLDKDRNSRYQTALELRDDLESLRRKLSVESIRARFRQPWLQALAAILLVATSVGTYRYLRWRQSQHTMSSDSIVLSDFSNTTGDPVFDETLKQALRVELDQSPFLRVLSDQQVSQELKYMRQPENQALTAPVAREVCVRSGANILLTGTVSRLASQYILDVNATECASGASRDSEQSVISSREKVLHSLVELATNLRGKLGESQRSIGKYSAPLEQATTSSLEALQNYSVALKTWNSKGEEAAIPFLEQATQLDPEFVIAWARLGDAYFNIGRDTDAVEALKKAYASRDKVSEPERFYIESRYHKGVTHQYEKGLQVDELWRQIYPRDVSPFLRAANAYARAGRHDKSLEMEAQALQLDPDNGFIYANMAFIYINLNQFDKAQEMLARAEEHHIYNPWFESIRYQLGFLKKDEGQMQRALAAVADKPSLQSFFQALQADTEAYAGHLTSARTLTRNAMESARRNNDADGANGYEVADSLREVEYGIPQRALEEAHAVLAAQPSPQVRVLAALALARAGDSASALAVAQDLNRDFPSDTLLNTLLAADH
jgi:eukaryotic-like serine/threonine-protein kinase